VRVDEPLPLGLPASAGFKQDGGGAMVSRTIMLAELTALLEALPSTATAEDYRMAIIEDNVLLKRSATTRRASARWLHELYALNSGVPVFAILRHFWSADEVSRPLLVCLCANARDPLLRMTAPLVLSQPYGASILAPEVAAGFAVIDPGRFRPDTSARIARNALSSWAQSGHLRGKLHKTRARPIVTPASMAYALLLGYLAGSRGIGLFTTFWTALLDCPPEQADTLAFEAGRRGWLEYRRIGDVVEIGFSALLRETSRG
jgi:hypothetical protein